MHCSTLLIGTSLLVASSIADLVHDTNLDQTIISSHAPTFKIYENDSNVQLKKFEAVTEEYAKKLQKYFETFAIADSKGPDLPNIGTMPEGNIYYLCHFLLCYDHSGVTLKPISEMKNGDVTLLPMEDGENLMNLTQTELGSEQESLPDAASRKAVEVVETYFSRKGGIRVHEDSLELGLVYDSNVYELKGPPTKDKLKYGQGLIVLKYPRTAAAIKNSEHLQIPVTDESKEKMSRLILSNTKEPKTKEKNRTRFSLRETSLKVVSLVHSL